jgi:hypothetical protein
MPSLDKSKAMNRSVGSVEPTTRNRQLIGPGSLLWINKTGSSASLSSIDGLEGSLARSHTQAIVASRRRKRKAKPLSSRFSRLADGFSQPIDGEVNAGCDNARPSKPASDHTNAAHPESANLEENYGGIPNWVLATSEVDPFNATTLAVDKFSRQLLTFHLAWWNGVAPKWKTWHEVDLFQPADVLVARKCFKDPLYMLTTTMFTAVQMRMLEIPCIGPNLPDVLHLKTIWLLRMALNDTDRDPEFLIEILAFLTLAEVFRKHFTAARLHLGAVKRLLDDIGDVSKILNHISEMIVFSDFYLALSTLEAPVLGRRIGSAEMPPVFDATGLQDIAKHRFWIDRLPHEALAWAAQHLCFCVQILAQSWTSPRLAVNGFWVRKRCVSIMLCLLDAWQLDGLSSMFAERSRITLLLWSAFLLSCTLDTQGVKNYIPAFDHNTVDEYARRGMLDISNALTKWNKILGHDFHPVPLGCDVILSLLIRVPSELETIGIVALGGVMERLAALEEQLRLQKASKMSPTDLARHHRWRVWRTSILLC